ncbi:hypothetical protein H0H92_003684 [Tricholoma furcatifolium]|nr:hypothetical protein H0H92_003684 [Tricholoma furcatifolium]
MNNHHGQWLDHYYRPQDRQPQALSLNLSSLSVTSPPSASPSTPVSPSVTQYNSQYQFDSSYDDQYDNRRTPGPSRSSSSTSSLPRKRSFTSTPVLEENILYDESRDAPMELASSQSYDDIDMRYPSSSTTTANGSPVDGSDANSGGEADPNAAISSITGVSSSMNMLGKPLAANNFVTKLYQMINDTKSAHYINWTELGTSFVVSNVGEFSRSILGSHFKHNNFSSFVRQLNMYGFHKINRTPRAQRTSTDAQTWEFSHHKFLRGRPDLLDEIKRKALEPDPALKHRVELPGEVAAQLGAMRDENRRVWEQLNLERKRTERLANTLQRLWEFVGTRVGNLPPFPQDLLGDIGDSPNIFITSPPGGGQSSSAGGQPGSAGAQGRFAPPPLSMNNVHMGSHASSLHTMHSPNSNSPTQPDFQPQPPGSASGPPPTLSRQHSFQHTYHLRGDASPLPASPGGANSSSMDVYDESDAPAQARISSKRPRISTAADDDHIMPHGSAPSSAHPESGSGSAGASSLSAMSSPGGVGVNVNGGRKASRARSDSAPLGYGFGGHTSASAHGGIGGMGMTAWGGVGRPRSGSGLAGRGVPNIGSASRGVGVGVGAMGVSSGLGSAMGMGGGLGGVGVGVLGPGVGVVGGMAGVGQGMSVGVTSLSSNGSVAPNR